MNRETLGIIFENCNGHCFYCGVKLDPFGSWQVDHVVPRAQGGGDDFHNLVAACRPCNASKGNRTAEQFSDAIIRRALNHATSAREILETFSVALNPWLARAIELIEEAENCIAGSEVDFYGTQFRCPAKQGDQVSEGFDDIAIELSVEASGEPSYSLTF
jgi:hypothetical protein